MYLIAYHYEADEVYPVPERVSVLNKIHDVRPALQGDDQEYRHPGQADVVERNGSMEGVGGAGGALCVILETRLTSSRSLCDNHSPDSS